MVDINELLKKMANGETKNFGVEKMSITPDGGIYFKGLKVDGPEDMADFNNLESDPKH